jgi:hypothetical protein
MAMTTSIDARRGLRIVGLAPLPTPLLVLEPLSRSKLPMFTIRWLRVRSARTGGTTNNAIDNMPPNQQRHHSIDESNRNFKTATTTTTTKQRHKNQHSDHRRPQLPPRHDCKGLYSTKHRPMSLTESTSARSDTASRRRAHACTQQRHHRAQPQRLGNGPFLWHYAHDGGHGHQDNSAITSTEECSFTLFRTHPDHGDTERLSPSGSRGSA